MYDFGADANANEIAFGNLAALDNPTAYSFAATITIDAGAIGTRSFFGKGDLSTGADGWWIEMDVNEKLRVSHGNGGYVAGTASTNALSGTKYVVVTWDGTNVKYYINKVANGTPAYNTPAATNAIAVKAGDNGVATALGASANIGHIMWWDTALSVQEAQSLPQNIPQIDNLKFWAPGWSDPGIEIVGQATATKAGTVNIVNDAVPYCMMPGRGQTWKGMPGIEYIYKVISDNMGLSEGSVGVPTWIQVVSDTLGVNDKSEEESGYNEPPGTLIDTVSGTSDSTDVVTDGTITTTWTIEESEGLSTEWNMTENVFIKKTEWT